MVSFADIAMGVRFVSRLPSFLRHPLTLKEAWQVLRERLERREADFLVIVRRAVYEHPGSPYRDLLKLAGCEYGDLERLVSQDGVEGALCTLFRHGVYLTVDEFKGRRPVVRGSTTIAADPGQLRNPYAAAHVPAQTSGSRGAASPMLISLAFIRDRAVDSALVLDAQGGANWLHADSGVPGAGGLAYFLEFSSFGAPPVRWFSLVDPAAPRLHPRYRWSGRALLWGSLLAGVSLPRPEFVSPDGPLPIVRWMVEVLRSGHTPMLHAFPSLAARVCLAASDAGLDLHGAQFMLSGEPTTDARLRVVRQAGAQALPRYSSTECGPIGYGCLAPESADDAHLLDDLHALIQPGPRSTEAGPAPAALLISSLRLTAPLILLNVALGDQAMVMRRACGCPLERLGWTTHLHTIRSYEKLTSGGMTFLDTDVIRVLEEVLPARFGGAPTDYQLLEDEADDGSPRLRLLVHPAVGPLDTEAVSETFLSAIGAGSGVERVMALLWRDAGLLRVERRAPLTTATGKILHLHTNRRSSERRSPGSRT